MLIKAFCTATGLPRDTVRFYVKRGLLNPSVGSQSGNRYQVFSEFDVERARVIRTAQAIGYSLREIAELAAEYDAGKMDPGAKVHSLKTRIAALDSQHVRLQQMRAYLVEKLRWVQDGEVGASPTLSKSGSATVVDPATGSIETTKPKSRRRKGRVS